MAEREYKKELTPERRARIVERCSSQLASMLSEAEGWYPDKVITSDRLRAEHGNYCDRLGSLASDMGYASFAELLRNEGFDIELDRRAAAHPVGHRIAPEDAVDHIVQSVTGKLQGYFDKIDGWYPDRVVTDFAKLHNTTKENLSRNAQALGYESWADLLRDHGYEVPDYYGSKGGRPSTFDPEAIISELMDRYEGLDKPKTIGILVFENPDMKGSLKTLQNNSNELFGHTLAVELKGRGLIDGGPSAAAVTEDDIREMLETLAAKYEKASIRPNTIAELKADNPEYRAVIAAFNDRCRMIFGVTPRNKLVELGIFERPRGSVIDASEDEVWQAVDELSKLVFELDDDRKPNTLSELQKAYPEYGEYIKAGKKHGFIDKAPLQELGILAPTKALLKRSGIRNAPLESLVDDYKKLGLPTLIIPGSSGQGLLPFGVAGIDVEAQVEIREFVVTVNGKAARDLAVGKTVSAGTSTMQRQWGDPFPVLNVHTSPKTVHSLEHLSFEDVEDTDSDLKTYPGGEVVSVTHGDAFDVAQVKVRFLSRLRRDTLAYAMRQSGAITDKDLRGSMEWRYRIRSSSSDNANLSQPIAGDDASQELNMAVDSSVVDNGVLVPASWDDYSSLGDSGYAFMSDSGLTDRQKEYLKIIADLSREFPHVRSSDVVERVGCSKSSFSNALQKLAEAGCVSVDNGYIRLSDGDRSKISRTLAKYLDVIEELYQEPPRIRSADAVTVLGCSKGTFSEALQELKAQKLVIQKDGYIMLASNAVRVPSENAQTPDDDCPRGGEEEPVVDSSIESKVSIIDDAEQQHEPGIEMADASAPVETDSKAHEDDAPATSQITPAVQVDHQPFDNLGQSDEISGDEAPEITAAAREYFDKIVECAVEKQPIRSNELAGLMGVSSAAVSKMMRRLKDAGLVETDIDGFIRLTERGCDSAGLACEIQEAPEGRAFMASPDFTASQKKYLSAIADIADSGAVVRAIDIANRLGVSKASVSKMLDGLKGAGLIEIEGRAIELTPLATGADSTESPSPVDPDEGMQGYSATHGDVVEEASPKTARWTFNNHAVAQGRRFSVEVPDQFVLTPENNGRPLARYEDGIDDKDECPTIYYGMSTGDLSEEVQNTYRTVLVPEVRIEVMRNMLYSTDMLNTIMQTVNDWVVEGVNCKVLVVEFKEPDIFGLGRDHYEYHVRPIAYDHEDFLRLADSWNRLAEGELREVALSIAKTVTLDKPVELQRLSELDKMRTEPVSADSFCETVNVVANILNFGANKRMNANTYRVARRAGNDKSVWLAGDTLPRVRAEAFNKSLEDDVAYLRCFVEALEKQAEFGVDGFDKMWDLVGQFADSRIVDHIVIEDNEEATREINALGVIAIPEEYQALRARFDALKPGSDSLGDAAVSENNEAEERLQAEEEAKRKAAEEEAQRKAAEEARLKAEEEAQRKAEAEKAEAERRAKDEFDAAKVGLAEARDTLARLERDATSLRKTIEKIVSDIEKTKASAPETLIKSVGEQLEAHRTELSSLGFFAFGRKRELKDAIASLEKTRGSLEAQIPSHYEDTVRALEGKLETAVADRNDLDDRIVRCKERVAELQSIVFGPLLEKFEGVSAGDTVEFGSYPQSSNDAQKEPISWTVLDKMDDRVLLLSTYVLDYMPFSKTRDNNYGHSDLKKWVTGAFKNVAFNSVEAMLLQDLPFIMGEKEFTRYLKTDESRICLPTNYALGRSRYCKSPALYWLSSSSDDGLRGRVYYVDSNGMVWGSGRAVYSKGTSFDAIGADAEAPCGARPAVWVKTKL